MPEMIDAIGLPAMACVSSLAGSEEFGDMFHLAVVAGSDCMGAGKESVVVRHAS